ncbi:hypothetical protein DXV76_09535 [Rhodobacteraceae bacterium CCMM004]|nr:hypothetical protein DXV76_09535 [Rhodobacteraceae bacterium CCMM004]
MGGGGIVWYILVAAAVVVPFWKILPRHGIAAPYALLAAIPVGAVILLWIVAFRDEFRDRDGRG